MLKIRTAVLAVALAAATPALGFQAVTTSNAVLRAAPSGSANQIGSLSAGTKVDVQICFDQGAYCAVIVGGSTGFVAGDYLRDQSSGAIVSATERAKWQVMQPVQIATTDTGSVKDVVAWGDSLTDGTGAPKGRSYTDQAAALLGGRLIANKGIGGQTSTSIAARMNAVPTMLTLESDIIPEIGPVSVIDRSALPVTNQGAPSLEGTLCGVPGSLEVSSKAKATDPVPPYVFARTSAGEATPCPPGGQITLEDGVTYRERVAWLWLGRNGAAEGHTVVDDIAAAVQSLGHDRYLVASIIVGPAGAAQSGDPTMVINAALKQRYGKRFVDVLNALANAAGDSDEDMTAKARGIVPPSLLSDSIHLNEAGYAVVAKAMAAATIANGF